MSKNGNGKNGNGEKPRVPFAIHIIAGGTAGMAEAVSIMAASYQVFNSCSCSSAASLWIPSKSECSFRVLGGYLVYVLIY